MSEVSLRFMNHVPEEYRQSIDTRIYWLWNQRFGVVQSILRDQPDPLDVTAANVVFLAVMANDLEPIALLFRRLEGGALGDTEVLEEAASRV